MTKYILFLFTFLFPLEIFSQTIANPHTSTEERFKSPQVHLLKQFVDHPVDLSRGLADITIPIYDIQFADKNIPIKLMFHASGLKADISENGMLGLKWAVNIGGFISREVRGYVDEELAHKTIPNSQNYIPDWITLYGGAANQFNKNNPIFNGANMGIYLGAAYNGVHGKYEDTEYDIFSFSLPNGESGKFILKDNNGSKSASFMPYKPYKLNIPVVEYNPGNKFVKFDIIDDQGYTYSFGSDTNNLYYESSPDDQYNKCWMLRSITSPNKKDIISFDYISTQTSTKDPLTPVVINDYLDDYNNYYRQDLCQGSNGNSLLYNLLESTLYDTDSYFVKNYNQFPSSSEGGRYLSKITYNDLTVNFVYANKRLLNSIELSNAGKVIKKAEFDVARPEGYQLNYLNSISIKGSTDEIIEKYNFDYYNLDKLPSPQKLCNSADYWGFYNSEVENVIQKDTVEIYWTHPLCHMTKRDRLLREIGSGNNRYSNPDDMKIGMIKSITYPTGGTTTFDYDGNQYKDNSIIRIAGGLRIKSIIDKDKNGNDLKKREFVYGQNEDGMGKIPAYLMPDANNINAFEETKTQYFAVNDMSIENEADFGTYTTRHVTGYFPGKLYTFLYNLISYDQVTEFYGDKNNNIGKIENYYATNIPSREFYQFDTNKFRYQISKPIIDPSNFWNGNHLCKKIDYKTENGVYKRVKQTDYLYEDKIVDEFYDLSIFRYKYFVGFATSTGGYSVRTAKEELEQLINNPGDYFGYKMQKYTIGTENLSGVKEELFFNDGKSIVNTVVNKYDINKPTFIKESITNSSKGDIISQKFLYPFNINAGVYSQMSEANVISQLVEKVALKNDKVVNSTVLTYKKSDTNFVPDQNYVSELNTSVPYSAFTNYTGFTKDQHYNVNPEISYDFYDDHGNPTQITSKGKIITCYVWGYDKKYPIAKIDNATYTAGLSNSITEFQQTLINNAVLATVGETTQATEINLISKLQLLREGFPNAMVSTYTYDPLTGVTSMTNPKGYINYYEYDVYNRLKQVKDNEGKILSANEYHYKN